QCFIFSHGDTYHHTMITEPVDKWKEITWTDELDKQLSAYLKSRWEGTQDWIWFHENPKFELQEIANEIGLDLSKPRIGLLTSVMWDAKLHYDSNAFPSMLDWVLKSIEYFIKRPELQLVIRVHPAEIHGTLPSRQKLVDEINKTYKSLPKNIIIISPESPVSTYAVMRECETVIIYNTKTGVELTAQGIPVIVAGEAWIRGKGFAIDADSSEEYYRVLDRLPLCEKMSLQDTLLAKKYAYHFFFRRMIPISSISAVKDDPPFRLDINSLYQLLPGKDPGLDLICDGILKGDDFIYPAEAEAYKTNDADSIPIEKK
ncbi:MAG: capsule biosynthesis protein, partial [Rubrobacteridae bacterium]|nr:capsule biosynthesis protein [Rubrobacteridae bacterium]